MKEKFKLIHYVKNVTDVIEIESLQDENIDRFQGRFNYEITLNEENVNYINDNDLVLDPFYIDDENLSLNKIINFVKLLNNNKPISTNLAESIVKSIIQSNEIEKENGYNSHTDKVNWSLLNEKAKEIEEIDKCIDLKEIINRKHFNVYASGLYKLDIFLMYFMVKKYKTVIKLDNYFPIEIVNFLKHIYTKDQMIECCKGSYTVGYVDILIKNYDLTENDFTIIINNSVHHYRPRIIKLLIKSYPDISLFHNCISLKELRKIFLECPFYDNTFKNLILLKIIDKKEYNKLSKCGKLACNLLLRQRLSNLDKRISLSLKILIDYIDMGLPLDEIKIIFKILLNTCIGTEELYGKLFDRSSNYYNPKVYKIKDDIAFELTKIYIHHIQNESPKTIKAILQKAVTEKLLGEIEFNDVINQFLQDPICNSKFKAIVLENKLKK